MCQGWIAVLAVAAIGLAVLLVLGLARALDEAEAQLATVLEAQRKLKRERDHLFDQVNRLQQARLERDLERIEAEEAPP